MRVFATLSPTEVAIGAHQHSCRGFSQPAFCMWIKVGFMYVMFVMCFQLFLDP